ncbi:MAG: ABC transporter ATP-binding protein, partial [Microbacterium sp.]
SIPIMLAAFFATRRISRSADRGFAEANTTLTERLMEFARVQPALRAARRVEPARSAAGEAIASQHAATGRLLLMQIPGHLLFSVASQLALILLAGTAVWVSMTGGLSAPAAIALIVVIVRFLEPFAQLAELTGGLESAGRTLDGMRQVLDAPAREMRGGTALTRTAPPRIDFDGVGLRYSDDGPAVIDELTLTLEPGSTTAIVGPSGSGKSSVLSLLLGLQQPTTGRVLVDGVDLRELPDAEQQALMTAVFQHPFLFEGTIEDNIRAGHLAATDGQIAHAMRLAQLDDTLAQLPDGAASRVGEAGSALSGGERQRVSIARALVKPAPVLAVDEATSALDTENERAVVAALTTDDVPRTRVIVAHRLAAIRTADRVLFLEDGRIVEDGTPDALLGAGGRFAEFWRQQAASADWRL